MLECGQFKTIYDDEMHFCAGTRLAASPVGRLGGLGDGACFRRMEGPSESQCIVISTNQEL